VEEVEVVAHLVEYQVQAEVLAVVVNQVATVLMVEQEHLDREITVVELLPQVAIILRVEVEELVQLVALLLPSYQPLVTVAQELRLL
jgi:hypothetical protein